MQKKALHFFIRLFHFCCIFILAISLENCCILKHSKKSIVNIREIEKTIMQQKPLAKNPIKALDIVKLLKVNATQNDVQTALLKFITECSHATRRDMPQIYESLNLLKQQKNVVEAFINCYNSIPSKDYDSRLFTLSLFGEMQHKDAFPFLKSVAWAPLSSENSSIQINGLGPREYEQMIQSKAVQCIAFIRNIDGTFSDEAEREIYKIVKAHFSMHVRICAIDALMWNHGDSQVIADTLYKILPENYHKYVGRPRFYSGANQQVFLERLTEWRKRWAKK